MISKTKINQRMKKKTNPALAEAIYLAKKKGLVELAAAISVPTKKQAKINLEYIKKSGAETVIIPGKVLSIGEIDKKTKVYALGFSKLAKEKLESAGCEHKTILQALKENKKISGKILN